MREKVDVPASYSIEKLFTEGLCGTLLVILAFWMILGVLYQVRDLRSTLVTHHDLIAEHRWGLRFEIFWRMIMAVLMSFCVLMVFLINEKIVVLPLPTDISYSLIGSFTDCVPAILLLALAGSVPYVRRKESSSLLHRGLYLIFCLLAAVFCLEQWIGSTIIHYLVHLTTVSMDHGQAPQFSSIDVRHYHAHTNLFFWWSISSGLIVVANWAILVRLARQWPMGFRRRLLWTFLLIAGITAASAFIFWVYAKGLKETSPYLAETVNEAPISYWMSAAFLVVVIVTVLTYRMAVDRGQKTDMPNINWRRNPGKYYHEWRTILVLMVIAIAFYCLNVFNLLRMLDSQLLWGVFPGPFNSWADWAGIFYGFFGMPIPCLWCALILLVLHRTIARREIPRILKAI